MIRVGFNARQLYDPNLRGLNRYAVNLLAELPAQGVELVLYSDTPIHPVHLARLPSGSYEIRQSPPMPYVLWEQRWLPRQCARDRVDLMHSPWNFSLPWASACPRVLTLHDAIEWAFPAPAGCGGRRALVPEKVRKRFHLWVAHSRAHRVITVSEHSKGDIIRLLGVPAERIDVTHEAADPRFGRPATADDRVRARCLAGTEAPYLFYVGGWEERKNIPFLVRALAEGPVEIALVLAGGRDEQRAALLELAGSLGVADRLRLLGWVADEDLPGLYAEALAFVYPSRYEGFGLQLCEAMAMGCPTLAARATSLPEILGEGGETFALGDPAELVALIRRLLDDPAFRADLARRALARAASFSWRRTAEQTVAAYRRALWMETED
ncbi:MAG: glycosyltransferase family 4 protein [Isosphaeraceae bacterium]|nr:glycosyltransferase family 4 protein [Isosphaeraceae bacterium]